jgi:heme-degrading monooxygenase HmoA
MYARATTLTVSGERQSESVEQYRAALSKFRQIPGNRGAFLLVDEGGGRGVGVTLWESEDAMTESRERAKELREQAAAQASGMAPFAAVDSEVRASLEEPPISRPLLNGRVTWL